MFYFSLCGGFVLIFLFYWESNEVKCDKNFKDFNFASNSSQNSFTRFVLFIIIDEYKSSFDFGGTIHLLGYPEQNGQKEEPGLLGVEKLEH